MKFIQIWTVLAIVWLLGTVVWLVAIYKVLNNHV